MGYRIVVLLIILVGIGLAIFASLNIQKVDEVIGFTDVISSLPQSEQPAFSLLLSPAVGLIIGFGVSFFIIISILVLNWIVGD